MDKRLSEYPRPRGKLRVATINPDPTYRGMEISSMWIDEASKVVSKADWDKLVAAIRKDYNK